jgi:hypothetical protein
VISSISILSRTMARLMQMNPMHRSVHHPAHPRIYMQAYRKRYSPCQSAMRWHSAMRGDDQHCDPAAEQQGNLHS